MIEELRLHHKPIS